MKCIKHRTSYRTQSDLHSPHVSLPTAAPVTPSHKHASPFPITNIPITDPHPSRLTYPDPPTRANDTTPARQIFTPFFSSSDRAINFHLPGSPIHNWYTYSTSPASTTGTILPNTAYLTLDALPSSPDTVSIPSYSFKIGIPFHGHHTASVSVSYSAAPMCRTSYLALGECTDGQLEGGNNMFICMTEIDSSPALCSHAVNLDAGRRSSSWTALALLAGWKPGTSSLGTVVAISPGCTRVAAASWDRVLVWSLDPGLLHQGSLETYFPACDWNRRKGLGRLRPVRLQAGIGGKGWGGGIGGKGAGGGIEGKGAIGGRGDVVYGLTWVSETTLYAVTDRGLVRWDVGPKAEGGREELKLAYDAWSEFVWFPFLSFPPFCVPFFSAYSPLRFLPSCFPPASPLCVLPSFSPFDTLPLSFLGPLHLSLPSSFPHLSLFFSPTSPSSHAPIPHSAYPPPPPKKPKNVRIHPHKTSHLTPTSLS